jgi:ribosomal protein S12 methylthiotransferase
VAGSAVPYFDLSLQHVSAPLVRRMRRPGDGSAYLAKVERARSLNPQAAFRSNFIVGYPGETEADHDQLLAFLEAARLDWCGFFAYSEEDGTHAAGLGSKVPTGLVGERLAELRELQDAITAERRDELIDTEVTVLVDEAGLARSHREAPEIDGMIWVPGDLGVGELHRVRIVGAEGPDLHAVAVPSAALEPAAGGPVMIAAHDVGAAGAVGARQAGASREMAAVPPGGGDRP